MCIKTKPLIVNKEVAKLLPHKYMTRRVIKNELKMENLDEFIKNHSRYQIGDILWIREPAKIVDYKTGLNNTEAVVEYINGERRTIKNIDKYLSFKGLDYPKWFLNKQYVPNGCLKIMARYFIKITNVRIEKLQDITVENSIREGLVIKNLSYLFERNIIGINEMNSKLSDCFEPIIKEQKEKFIKLWNSTATKGYKWEDNPYVWVYEWDYI